jgi:hypothetical protein
MIIQFQVVPSRHGDTVYTLDDQGTLRVKQPQQVWREVAGTGTEYTTVESNAANVVNPVHTAEQILTPRPSLLDGYTL